MTDNKNGITNSVQTEMTTYDDVTTKQGHKCCGFCCDVRRAVIIVNTIGVVFGILGLFGLSSLKYVVNNSDNYATDDKTQADLEDMKKIPYALFMVLQVISILVNAIGIWGAVKYNVFGVAISALQFVVYIIWYMVILQFLSIIGPALFLYPHIYLIMEIRNGIMTPETYKTREEHSCCCV